MGMHRITPLNIFADIEAADAQCAIERVIDRLTDAGFTIPKESHFEVRDGRAVSGEDSGSPQYVLFTKKEHGA
jgi:hypothetical protein